VEIDMASSSSQAAPSEGAEPKPRQSTLPFPVVGIGGLAGGMAAALRFFEHLPSSPGMAFVVVLHLSPQHESNAAAILQCSRSGSACPSRPTMPGLLSCAAVAWQGRTLMTGYRRHKQP
jgi:two-component system CheB/CheR fusion protein